MGCPLYQSYPEFQNHEFNLPTYQLDYSNHYPSFPSHPYQTYPSEAGDHIPTWSDEGWQTQDTHYHQDQTCPDQHQYQPQPQQNFGPPLDENHYAKSTEGESEGLVVSQQNMRSCTRSNDELVMEMQRTFDEQQSSMGDMIKQVALLTEMMKEVNESREKEEGVKEAEEEKTLGAEQKSGALVEKQKEIEAVEVKSAEKEALAEEESITTPLDDEESKEILEEAHDEPPEKEEKVIERDVKLDNTLLYLQSEKVYVPDEKVEEFTTTVKGEDAPAERPLY